MQASWSLETTREKFRLYHQTRDLGFRDEIVSEYLPLVYSIAQRYSDHGEPIGDLIQEGSIGLMRAVDFYDQERGIAFSTFAGHLITSQIVHALRDCGHLIRQPDWVRALNTRVTHATNVLTSVLGRDPSPAEIGRYLNLKEESVQEVLAARELNRVVSLTAPAESADDELLLLIDKEKIRQQKHETMQLPIEDRIALEESIGRLKSVERMVIRLFFFAGLSLAEIARRLSISTPRSSRLLRQSIDKIKANLDEPETDALPDEFSGLPPLAVTIPTYDKVTGVHSEAYLRAHLEKEIGNAQRERTRFALVMLKVLHLTGKDPDEQFILAAMGQTLRRVTHATDITAYLGDGCFGILLLHVDAEAQLVSERLCHDIRLRHGEGAPSRHAIRFNVGYAVFPMDSFTVPELFSRAAHALTMAIATGPDLIIRGKLNISCKSAEKSSLVL